MKTAEHYLMRWRDCEFDIDEAIELAQKEAYNQALEDAIENTTLSLFDWTNDGFKEFKQNSNHYLINDGTYVEIDKQSILKLKKMKTEADKLRNSIQYGLGVMDSGSGEFKELSNKIDELFELSYLESQSSPKIKQLEWEDNENCLTKGITARTSFCTYQTMELSNGNSSLFADNKIICQDFPIDYIKQYAQEDFEARVKECLIIE